VRPRRGPQVRSVVLKPSWLRPGRRSPTAEQTLLNRCGARQLVEIVGSDEMKPRHPDVCLRRKPTLQSGLVRREGPQGDICSAANFVPEPKPGLSAVYLENDFSPLMRSAGEHLVSAAHIVQRQKGAYLRAQLSTAKQPRNSVQPFRTDFSVEKY
jgi:hypothetical protein